MEIIPGTTESDFDRARAKALLNGFSALVRRRPNELVSFEKVRHLLRSRGSNYGGIREVPLDRIIGTATNRYHDFDRAFLPAHARTKARWKSIDEARLTGVDLPPVQLYQIGDVYFVRDGHHRVSVAREKGEGYIDAEVIRVQTRVPLTADEHELDPRNLERIGEYAEFLERTRFDEIVPGVEIRFSEPGGYTRLVQHITVHRYYLGLEHKREATWDEAVKSWHEHFYSPVVKLVQEQDLLKQFPGRTAADLYLWIMDHHYYLRKRSLDADLATAAQDYAAKFSPRWSRRIARGLQRVADELSNPHLPFRHREGESAEGSTATAPDEEGNAEST